MVFCFRGDLWTVPVTGGIMRCIVPGESIEHSPCHSPDGRYIAFTSDRTGGGDVYFTETGGGLSTRLTFHAGTDLALCWNASSDSVYFLTSREGGDSWVYSVPVTGGTPCPVARVTAENLCLLPDGMAVERGFTEWWRKHYRGSAARRIWVGGYGEWSLLDGSDLDSRWPMYSSLTGEVLFVREDGSGHGALWSVGPSGESVQRTFLTDGDITFPSISADGSVVVFEFGGVLRGIEIPSYKLFDVPLTPGSDVPFPLEYGESTGFTTDCFHIDSSSVQISVVGTGDIFAGRLSDGEIEDLVEIYSGPFRARDPVWSPDCRTLAFTLEHDGRIELAFSRTSPEDSILADRVLPGYSVLRTASDVAREPKWSPDGSRISYLDRDSRLHVVDVGSGRDITVCDTPYILHHSWSPDGRWLAFSVPVLAHREDVFVVPSGGGDPVNISRHPNDDFQPFWPSDGRRLIYASRTDDGDYSIKQVWFSRETWDLENDDREELLDQPVPSVDIQWEELSRRTETLCTVEGYYDFFGASPDGRLIAFPGWDDKGRMDLWTVDWRGESLNRVTHSGETPHEIQVMDSGDIYFISVSGSVRKATSEGGVSGSLGWHMPVWRSIPGIQAQKFDEAWRLLRDEFYDPEMHRVDWDSVRALYRDRALACIINEDFNDVVRRMLGELSASHLGIYGPRSWNGSPSSGELGIMPDHSWSGPGIMVDSVIPYSPADLEDSRLQPGDVILSVQGMQVGPENNLYRALLQRGNRETDLRIVRDGSTIELKIEPVSIWEMQGLLYDEWVHANRREVSRLTDDRVGYLHIPSMSNRSVQDFLVDLFAEGMEREGLIIDIRGNGGGSTHDDIIRQLARPMYAFSTDRYGNITFEPLGVWQKPMVLLVNERCYSDAEIFPAGWKQLAMGPVVGETTFGAVIGTSDVTLVDGTGFRVPSTGWFTLTGRNLENTGVEPDIRVVEGPEDAGLGIDRQLETAAEVILEMI
ncbi:MAG: hypothetical protein AVO35_05170 [Candidatus Aegiribacteria sp. MLS_C]|nr:MAG: hypothetical protein AVO35_05170 [Candidatus Aegiribacteria sp. MLS_C]